MNKEQQGFLVDGFLFQEEEDAEKAKREAEGIQYIKTNTSMDNPRMVWQVYDKIIQQKMFETPIGIAYLRELREYLLKVPAIDNDKIRPIPTDEFVKREYVTIKGKEKKPAQQKERPEEERPQEEKSGQRLRISLAANVVLVLMVIAMFAITMSSNHPNILNYEENLLNKYAGWEEELTSRERQIMEKERELGLEQ